jgi:NADH-quinone oxidoreductase subunit L
MWKMGGLKTKLPLTFVAYTVGTLAIAGFPLLSGFYSKEEILGAAFVHSSAAFAWLSFASLLTSFYMFRSLFLTFFGVPRDKHAFEHAHESPLLMTIPLVVLSLLSVFVGFGMHHDGNLAKWISWGEHAELAESAHMTVLLTSLSVFLIGLIGAGCIYLSRAPYYDALSAKFAGAYRILRNRYYIDELYLWFIDRVYHPLARGLAQADYDLVDQILVDGNAGLTRRLSALVRRMQSGLAQSYLFWMVLGLGVMAAWVAQRYK